MKWRHDFESSTETTGVLWGNGILSGATVFEEELCLSAASVSVLALCSQGKFAPYCSINLDPADGINKREYVCCSFQKKEILIEEARSIHFFKVENNTADDRK